MSQDQLNPFKLLKKKFVKDGFWLLSSQIILAVSGILINVLLTQRFGTAGFGMFSLGLRIYLILSLLAVFGCGASLIKHIGQFKDYPDELNRVINNALQLGLLISILLSLISYFAAPVTQVFFDDISVDALRYWILGIPIFTMNKILMAVLNGTRNIKQLAIAQASRWLLVFSWVVFFIYSANVELDEVALAFPLAEIILLPFNFFLATKHFKFSFKSQREWYNKHFVFGGQAMLSTAIIDLYTYADVFMIGLFMNAKAVGIYSFASDIAKNLLTLANIIQVNFNPIISDLWHRKELNELKTYISRVRKMTYLAYLPLTIIAIPTYYLFITNFMDIELIESIIPFTILSFGIFILSGFKTIYALPELSGRPQGNLQINFVVLLLNLVLNYLLMSIWGLNGIALATSLSYVFSIFLLYFYIQRKLSINLFNT